MNVVLSIEAIHPPLTGIGRYAWELATRLPQQEGIDSVRFIADGRWRTLPRLDAAPASPLPRATSVQRVKARLRHQLGRVPLVARTYAKVVPWLAERRMQSLHNAVFHGPNYSVPNLNLPSLVTVHDLSTYRYPQWHPQMRVERMRRAIPEALQRARYVLTDSEATRAEVLQEFSLPAERVVAIPLGVDAAFHPRAEPALQPVLARFALQPGAYTLFVSTVEPRKNLLNLLHAYAALPEALRRRYPLVVAGGQGWQSEDIHDALLRAAQAGWLYYLGYVEESCLPALYAGCRLFAYPSWYEGFGLPIAEAMASGVPVLTSDCSSMPEVAAGTAWLVTPGDVASIRAGLEAALQDESWRAQARAGGLLRAQELSWSTCVTRTAAVYRQARADWERA